MFRLHFRYFYSIIEIELCGFKGVYISVHDLTYYERAIYLAKSNKTIPFLCIGICKMYTYRPKKTIFYCKCQTYKKSAKYQRNTVFKNKQTQKTSDHSFIFMCVNNYCIHIRWVYKNAYSPEMWESMFIL